ncbi:hypothetical protein PhCBS80983_g04011 [Powellomyces hirtus]|uniref:F-box domain-containing protein n=1 Tax=Powellomyces hirtus TaxID=109895 RepID=A0A507E240_9FUNG|nr:hypothetical protein PhCBS80983_g04011 [Powellomyces hirtus]
MDPPSLLSLFDITSVSGGRAKTPIIDIIAQFLSPHDILRLTQLNKALHSKRRHASSGELWWFLSFHTPPGRGMRPAERRRDWRRLVIEKYEAAQLAARSPTPVTKTFVAESPHMGEIMEPSELAQYQRPKLTSEEKMEARMWYKELKNKKTRGKGPERGLREFYVL